MKAIVQDNYISGVVNGKPFSLNASHPTFPALKRAIQSKNWKRVPKLLSVAESLASVRNGSVQVRGGNVYYHARRIDSSLTKRIVAAVKEGKPVSAMLKFLDNLYQNPDTRSVQELYDWMVRCNMPITDDGCFMAYKAVTEDYLDKHSGTLNNSVGNVVMMPRRDVDPDRRNECSRGLHFCSLNYVKHFYGTGDKLLGIKVNPKDVVSIPADYEYSKGRAWRYEVVMEVADADPVVQGKADAVIFQTSVLPVERDRKVLVGKLLSHPTVKRLLKKRKLKVSNIRKGTLGRLTKLYAGLPVKDVPTISRLTINPIKVAREQAKVTLRELAEEMDITPKEVYDAERFQNVGQQKTDLFLRAINNIVETRGRQTVTA